MAGSAKRRKGNHDSGKAGAAAAVTAKKISPYFNFCTINREKVKQSNPNVSINKALSALWKSLSDEQKAAYSKPNPPPQQPSPLTPQPPANSPEEADNDIRENNDVNKIAGCDIDDGESSAGAPPFPLARVRRIIKLDREINKVNGEVVWAVASAAQSFLELLGEAALRVSVEKKRKTIMFDDVVTAISRHQRMADFLEDSIADIGKEGTAALSSDQEDEEGEDAADGAPKPPAPAPPPGMRSITDFFASKTAPPPDS